ncbi:MAG: 3-methyl-2-oxobutanoate hydroxymethyltransferase [Elusimicrobia bacterium]|nr:3-methyl-2-oxobutanoate hydroxymethyltransferase [Elusimicrobiota bacterium]
MKSAGEKIVALTAYDAPMARLVNAAGVDVVLVGDSVGNVKLGYANTLPVTVEEMLHHTPRRPARERSRAAGRRHALFVLRVRPEGRRPPGRPPREGGRGRSGQGGGRGSGAGPH